MRHQRPLALGGTRGRERSQARSPGRSRGMRGRARPPTEDKGQLGRDHLGPRRATALGELGARAQACPHEELRARALPAPPRDGAPPASGRARARCPRRSRSRPPPDLQPADPQLGPPAAARTHSRSRPRFGRSGRRSPRATGARAGGGRTGRILRTVALRPHPRLRPAPGPAPGSEPRPWPAPQGPEPAGGPTWPTPYSGLGVSGSPGRRWLPEPQSPGPAPAKEQNARAGQVCSAGGTRGRSRSFRRSSRNIFPSEGPGPRESRGDLRGAGPGGAGATGLWEGRTPAQPSAPPGSRRPRVRLPPSARPRPLLCAAREALAAAPGTREARGQGRKGAGGLTDVAVQSLQGRPSPRGPRASLGLAPLPRLLQRAASQSTCCARAEPRPAGRSPQAAHLRALRANQRPSHGLPDPRTDLPQPSSALNCHRDCFGPPDRGSAWNPSRVAVIPAAGRRRTL